MYQRYQRPLYRRTLGPLSTNGSCRSAPSTGPRPTLSNDLPPSRLTAAPMATSKGTDAHRVHPP